MGGGLVCREVKVDGGGGSPVVSLAGRHNSKHTAAGADTSVEKNVGSTVTCNGGAGEGLCVSDWGWGSGGGGLPRS